jgi:hypothetical protein
MYEIAQKFEGNMALSVVITLWESLTNLMNYSD